MPKIRDLGINSIPTRTSALTEEKWYAGGQQTSACGQSSCADNDDDKDKDKDKDKDDDDVASECGGASCGDKEGIKVTLPFAPDAVAQLRQQLDAHLGMQ